MREMCAICGKTATFDTKEEGGSCYCKECYYRLAQEELVKVGLENALNRAVEEINCGYKNCPVCDPRYRKKKTL
jgi:hypothetical protein